MKNEAFLEELEARLKENRRLADDSRWPEFLKPMVSYLGFHPLRVLVGLSLFSTLVMFGLYYESLMALSRKLFLFL